MREQINRFVSKHVLNETIVDAERQETLALLYTLYAKVGPWIVEEGNLAEMVENEVAWPEILEGIDFDLSKLYGHHILTVEKGSSAYAWWHENGWFFADRVNQLFFYFMDDFLEYPCLVFHRLQAFCVGALEVLDEEENAGIRECS